MPVSCYFTIHMSQGFLKPLLPLNYTVYRTKLPLLLCWYDDMLSSTVSQYWSQQICWLTSKPLTSDDENCEGWLMVGISPVTALSLSSYGLFWKHPWWRSLIPADLVLDIFKARIISISRIWILLWYKGICGIGLTCVWTDSNPFCSELLCTAQPHPPLVSLLCFPVELASA